MVVIRNGMTQILGSTMKEIFSKIPDDNVWVDKEGKEYNISEMSDFHLFSVMEALTKMTRMRRRREIDYLAGLVEMYDAEGEAYLSKQAKHIQDHIEEMFNAVSSMNTDAYGKEHIPHYEAIMIEAAKRGMRDSFTPDYDKNEDA